MSTQENENGAQAREVMNPDNEAPQLAADARSIRTIQLHPKRQRRRTIPVDAQLPVVALDAGDQLQLSFDLMAARGRPLNVYFYQATRQWERRLSPSEYMQGFQRDDLTEYQPSEATQVNYTHYTYAFPNERIGFTLSGNYILRVTEPGDEEAVLFERAFYISEQEGGINLQFDRVPVAGFNGLTLQPLVRIRPPRDLEGRVFDFTACFVRDGRVDRTRCADQPQLMDQPTLQFELDRQRGFAPAGEDYRLDLRALQTTRQIEAIDRAPVPFRVRLAPDLARFPNPGTEVPLNGQPVTSRVRDVPTPETNGEYVQATFQFVPPEEEPVNGEVVLVGSFNNWTANAQAPLLTWDSAQRRYVGEVQLKQGEYEYRYVRAGDRRLRSLAEGLPPQRSTITAFIYYRDPQRNTDRLIAFTDELVRP
ncbi:MAG: DUF5103 domain-containing protein [Bacteroidetes bacterium]|nr:DUF5103 domain-containing protein [Bacteroidota bacterium]